MGSLRIALVGLALAGGLVIPADLSAAIIYLINGNQLIVEAWRESGDVIEFASGGGIVRIAKREIRRIDGRPVRGDLRMYSSGVSSSGPATSLDREAAVKRMTDLLKQGEGLFGQTVLTMTEKAGAFRRLAEKWREFQVPDPIQDAYTRGQQAIQLAVDAFAGEGEETAPEVRERVEKARSEVQAAYETVQKLSEQG